MTIQYGTRAADGVLEIEIVATATTLDLAGSPAQVLAYNGELPGPTFVVRAGERVRILFTNRLDEPTNLHLHGMHMPPQVDDPHRVAAPGETLTYEFDVPADGAGTYWYHPHVHGEVAHQLARGLAGAFVVHGDADLALRSIAQEHVLVLQDLALVDGKPRARTPLEMHDGFEGDLVLTSGVVAPSIPVEGGLVRVRVVNASSARFYDLEVLGAELVMLGIDACLLEAPVALEHVLVPPGQRVDLALRATSPGTITLRHRPYRRGTFRWPWQRDRLPNDGVLARFDVRSAAPAPELPVSPPLERVDPTTAEATRIFEYGGTGGMLKMVFEVVGRKRYGAGAGARGPVRFWLNDREFEPGRIDAEARLGTTEIWEIRNPTPLDHPFHLHVYPFQVLDIDGEPPAFTAWQDVVNVPAGTTVRIAIPFRDFTGVTMFHCHILEHEDNGMMAHLRVTDALTDPESARDGAGHCLSARDR